MLGGSADEGTGVLGDGAAADGRRIAVILTLAASISAVNSARDVPVGFSAVQCGDTGPVPGQVDQDVVAVEPHQWNQAADHLNHLRHHDQITEDLHTVGPMDDGVVDRAGEPAEAGRCGGDPECPAFARGSLVRVTGDWEMSEDWFAVASEPADATLAPTAASIGAATLRLPATARSMGEARSRIRSTLTLRSKTCEDRLSAS